MSDDWAKKYVASYKRAQEEKQRKEEDDRRQRDYAEARGPEKFQRIWDRIIYDIHVLKDMPLFQSAKVDLSASAEGFVELGEDLKAQLKVRLVDTRLIQYEYSFSPKPEARVLQVHVGPKSKTLRICADLDAIITVHDDENKKVFSDDADISEFLLTPLLDYLSK